MRESSDMLICSQTKSDFTENDAIVDEVAGQAYIEQFGLETFQRAENTMKANRVSRYEPSLYAVVRID